MIFCASRSYLARPASPAVLTTPCMPHLEVLEEEFSSSAHSCPVAARHQHPHGHQGIYAPAAITIMFKSATLSLTCWRYTPSTRYTSSTTNGQRGLQCIYIRSCCQIWHYIINNNIISLIQIVIIPIMTLIIWVVSDDAVMPCNACGQVN